MGYLIYIIIIGGIAGWVASNFMKGQSLGLLWNIVLGIGGAFVGNFIFSTLLGMSIGSNWVGAIFTATVGAVIVLYVVNKFKK